VTPFSRFRLHPSGNTDGTAWYTHQTVIVTMRTELKHVESKASNTDTLPTHFMI